MFFSKTCFCTIARFLTLRPPESCSNDDFVLRSEPKLSLVAALLDELLYKLFLFVLVCSGRKRPLQSQLEHNLRKKISIRRFLFFSKRMKKLIMWKVLITYIPHWHKIIKKIFLQLKLLKNSHYHWFRTSGSWPK